METWLALPVVPEDIAGFIATNAPVLRTLANIGIQNCAKQTEVRTSGVVATWRASSLTLLVVACGRVLVSIERMDHRCRSCGPL